MQRENSTTQSGAVVKFPPSGGSYVRDTEAGELKKVPDPIETVQVAAPKSVKRAAQDTLNKPL